MVRGISVESSKRVLRICDVLDGDPRLWIVYADDVRSFVDRAIEQVARLQEDKAFLYGIAPHGKIRGDQAKHKRRVWNERRHVCESCGCILTYAISRLHHIIPVKDGGAYEDDNLMMVCANCHASLHSE